MINYISVRYERHRAVEGYREKRGKGRIIHNYQEGECCYSSGKIWCGWQGIRWEMSLLPTPQPTDLLSRAMEYGSGRIYFWHSRFESKCPVHFLHIQCRLNDKWGVLPRLEWPWKSPGKPLSNCGERTPVQWWKIQKCKTLKQVH